MSTTVLGLPRSAAEAATAKKRSEERRALRLAIGPHEQPGKARIVPGTGKAMALPSEACLEIGSQILDSCRDELARYERHLRGPGPRAQVSVYALIFGMLLVFAMRLDGIFLTDVRAILEGLSAKWKKRLGLLRPNGDEISYRQVHHRLKRLLRAIAEVEPAFEGIPVNRRIQAFAIRLLLLHLEACGISAEDLCDLAIDSSSIETPAAVQIDESVIEGDRRWTKDREAGPGHWPAKNGRRSGSHIGFDTWTLVNVSGMGLDGIPRPGVVVGLGLAYPNKGNLEVIELLDVIRAQGIKPKTMRADLGISTLVDDKRGGNFHERLAERNVRLIHEASQTNRKPAPDVRGAAWVDSGLCCPCAPQGQVPLPAHARQMNKQDRLELAARYDERARYHFSERQHQGVAGGGWRLECPARAGKVRCPLVAKSMLRGMDQVPTIHPPENLATKARLARVDPEAAGKLKLAPDCCVQETITLKPSIEPGRYQSIGYGTTRWVEAYGQRSKVEGDYGDLKSNFSSLRRGSYRYFGKEVPTLFIGLALMWVNHMTLRSFDYRFELKT